MRTGMNTKSRRPERGFGELGIGSEGTELATGRRLALIAPWLFTWAVLTVTVWAVRLGLAGVIANKITAIMLVAAGVLLLPVRLAPRWPALASSLALGLVGLAVLYATIASSSGVREPLSLLMVTGTYCGVIVAAFGLAAWRWRTQWWFRAMCGMFPFLSLLVIANRFRNVVPAELGFWIVLVLALAPVLLVIFDRSAYALFSMIGVPTAGLAATVFMDTRGDPWEMIREQGQSRNQARQAPRCGICWR